MCEAMIGSRGKTTAIAAAVLTVAVCLVGIVACRRFLLETYFLWKLESKDRRARGNAASWLGEHKSERAVPRLMELFRSTEEIDPDTEGATALRRIGPAAVPALAEALRDTNPEVRRETAHVLQRMGPEAKGAVPALAEALGSSERSLRESAAAALRAMGPEAVGAVPELVRGLEVGDDSFRITCCRTLVTIGSEAREAIPALEERTHDEDQEVRDAAAQALEHIRSGKPGIPGPRGND
jgi:HEAT repeat protein